MVHEGRRKSMSATSTTRRNPAADGEIHRRRGLALLGTALVLSPCEASRAGRELKIGAKRS
jgi:hypothetical protein